MLGQSFVDPEAKMNPKQSLWAGSIAAIGASVCCVGPLLLLSLGISGAWIANLTLLEPWRPLFVAATLALLYWAWHGLYRRQPACADDRPCATTAIRRRQRLIFWLVSVTLLLLLALPWFAPLFY